jgi:hypothetical protein
MQFAMYFKVLPKIQVKRLSAEERAVLIDFRLSKDERHEDERLD